MTKRNTVIHLLTMNIALSKLICYRKREYKMNDAFLNKI